MLNRIVIEGSYAAITLLNLISMFIPKYLTELGNKSPEHKVWVDSLPYIVENLKDKWSLTISNPCIQNATCSLVLKCTTRDEVPAVLKIGIPHPEAKHEIEGLKLLNGYPTVKLLDYHKMYNAMLLEKCIPGYSLKNHEYEIQDQVICALLHEIWKADRTQENFQTLGQMVDLWNKETLQNLDHFPDPDLAKQGCNIKNELIQSTKEFVFLATDLHAGNVLKTQRKPWLAIDIKPHIGDRTYDLTQHLLNCMDRLEANPVETIHRIADLAKISKTRLKDWMIARLATENKGIHQKLALRILSQ